MPAATVAAATPAASGKTVSALPGYQIISLGRGHNNRLCLAATVAGIKGLMILDTGASVSTLVEQKYGFLLSKGGKLSAKTPKTFSVNGMSSPVAVAPDYKVGQQNLGGGPIPLVPRRFLFEQSPFDTSGAGRQYDGLMGENILRPCNAVVDCGRLLLYLNTDRTRKLNLVAGFTGGGWTRVPMSDLGPDFTVPCVVNGHKFRVIVDTGAPFTKLNLGLLHGAGVGTRNLPMRGSIIGTQAVEEGLAQLESLQVGDYTATGIHMIATPFSFDGLANHGGNTADGPVIGLLGSDILADNAAVVDVGDKTLFLKHVAKVSTNP